MVRADKGKRKSVSKLKRYADLRNEVASVSSASSKAKGEASSSKGKSPKSPSSIAKEKITKEMEEIEVWVMSKKNLTVQSDQDMEMLVDISKKRGHYKGNIKIKCGNPDMKQEMRKIAKEGNLKFY